MSKCPIFSEKSADIGKLILRLCVGLMMLPHGIYKIVNGIDGVKGMMVGFGLPEFTAYGVYMGEIIAPIMIIIGFRARLGALFVIFTMIVAIAVTSGFSFLGLDSHGGFNAEIQLLYILSSVAIMLIGAGKYSIDKR